VQTKAFWKKKLYNIKQGNRVAVSGSFKNLIINSFLIERYSKFWVGSKRPNIGNFNFLKINQKFALKNVDILVRNKILRLFRYYFKFQNILL
jgi:hypothetical protein